MFNDIAKLFQGNRTELNDWVSEQVPKEHACANTDFKCARPTGFKPPIAGLAGASCGHGVHCGPYRDIVRGELCKCFFDAALDIHEHVKAQKGENAATEFLLSYDVSCLVDRALQKVKAKSGDEFATLHPELAKIDQSVTTVCPKFHGTVHGLLCWILNMPDFKTGAGMFDGEFVERFWSLLRRCVPANVVRSGPHTREDCIAFAAVHLSTRASDRAPATMRWARAKATAVLEAQQARGAQPLPDLRPAKDLREWAKAVLQKRAGPWAVKTQSAKTFQAALLCKLLTRARSQTLRQRIRAKIEDLGFQPGNAAWEALAGNPEDKKTLESVLAELSSVKPARAAEELIYAETGLKCWLRSARGLVDALGGAASEADDALRHGEAFRFRWQASQVRKMIQEALEAEVDELGFRKLVERASKHLGMQ